MKPGRMTPEQKIAAAANLADAAKNPLVRNHIAEEAERREREKQRKSALRDGSPDKAQG